MAGSGRDEDEDEDEAMVWGDSGNLAAVLFGRESSKNVSKVLAQGHYDRADLQNYSALWIRGLLLHYSRRKVQRALHCGAQGVTKVTCTQFARI